MWSLLLERLVERLIERCLGLARGRQGRLAAFVVAAVSCLMGLATCIALVAMP